MAGLLPDSEILALRELAESIMQSDVYIFRRSLQDDGRGGRKPAYPDSPSFTIKGYLMPAAYRSPNEKERAGQVQPDEAWLLWVAAGTDIVVEDRVQVGNRLFDVQGVEAPRTYEARRRVTLTLMRQI